METVLFNKDGTQLIIAVREDNYLHYINTETLQEHFVNMNATGDDHVSFTALDMSLSPDGKFVLVSTDRNRLIMFATGTPFQARNFYGVPNDQWSTPRTAWNLTQSFIYSVRISVSLPKQLHNKLWLLCRQRMKKASTFATLLPQRECMH